MILCKKKIVKTIEMNIVRTMLEEITSAYASNQRKTTQESVTNEYHIVFRRIKIDLFLSKY